jgi:hypothetical protein
MEGSPMRRLIVLLTVLAALALPVAEAQLNAVEILCEECRDPDRYPDDWANFAFNQVYGDEAWMDFDEADDFFIYNLRGDRVYVDIDYIMKGFNVFGQELPLWPQNKLSIELALPNGKILKYIRSIFMHPMPVPAPGGPNDDSSESDDSSGGEADDDYGAAEDDGLPEPGIDNRGIVEIVDPDEDGYFPEWCEEC